MTFYSPKNSEELEKIKTIIEQKKNIKKMNLNKKIQKQTQNYDLAEQYAPITDLQKKTTEDIMKGQQEQKLAIEDQTKAIRDQTNIMTNMLPELPEEMPAIPDNEVQINAIDAGISDKLNRITDKGSYDKFNFIKKDLNNYSINKKPFQIVDKKLKFDNKEYEISPNFFKIFRPRINKLAALELTRNLSSIEKEALPHFVEYACGLGKDVKSKIYKAIKFLRENPDSDSDGDSENFADLELQGQERELEGRGVTNYVFLSSNPDSLVERLEVLVGEHFAGNKNAYREASAILNELLKMDELSKNEYENGMNIFIE